jgi:hypothetical protein
LCVRLIRDRFVFFVPFHLHTHCARS